MYLYWSIFSSIKSIIISYLLSHAFVFIFPREHHDWQLSASKISVSRHRMFNIPYIRRTLPPGSVSSQDCRPINFPESHRHMATCMSKNTLKDIRALEIVHWMRPRGVFLIRRRVLARSHCFNLAVKQPPFDQDDSVDSLCVGERVFKVLFFTKTTATASAKEMLKHCILLFQLILFNSQCLFIKAAKQTLWIDADHKGWRRWSSIVIFFFKLLSQ